MLIIFKILEENLHSITIKLKNVQIGIFLIGFNVFKWLNAPLE
jgi:hypothetical protein